jgi:hypothetical protein
MGCMLYEAATRRRAFAADTDVEVMHQAASRALAAPARRKPLVAGIAAVSVLGVGGLAVGLYGLMGAPGSSSGRDTEQISILMSQSDLGEAVPTAAVCGRSRTAGERCSSPWPPTDGRRCS